MIEQRQKAVWHETGESEQQYENEAVGDFTAVLSGRFRIGKPQIPQNGRIGDQKQGKRQKAFESEVEAAVFTIEIRSTKFGQSNGLVGRGFIIAQGDGCGGGCGCGGDCGCGCGGRYNRGVDGGHQRHSRRVGSV